MAQR
ncbi:homeobox protein Meis1, partial [Trichinella spiralis]